MYSVIFEIALKLNLNIVNYTINIPNELTHKMQIDQGAGAILKSEISTTGVLIPFFSSFVISIQILIFVGTILYTNFVIGLCIFA